METVITLHEWRFLLSSTRLPPRVTTIAFMVTTKELFMVRIILEIFVHEEEYGALYGVTGLLSLDKLKGLMYQDRTTICDQVLEVDRKKVVRDNQICHVDALQSLTFFKEFVKQQE
ncbi:hypothetical protein L6452_08294 [Arctium lappa]|uniref:Uncharacterized protein n=1 Tax=Arctium lappa TaxID=4217 RepID=A0ACB9DGT6_ARCLA|nr:hypothetical protein L6452_08294 [Arctium lappa]